MHHHLLNQKPVLLVQATMDLMPHLRKLTQYAIEMVCNAVEHLDVELPNADGVTQDHQLEIQTTKYHLSNHQLVLQAILGRLHKLTQYAIEMVYNAVEHSDAELPNADGVTRDHQLEIQTTNQNLINQQPVLLVWATMDLMLMLLHKLTQSAAHTPCHYRPEIAQHWKTSGVLEDHQIETHTQSHLLNQQLILQAILGLLHKLTQSAAHIPCHYRLEIALVIKTTGVLEVHQIETHTQSHLLNQQLILQVTQDHHLPNIVLTLPVKHQHR